MPNQSEPGRGPLENTQRIIVYLAGGLRLEGELHVPRHSRMLDLLNHQAEAKPFIALTDVTWTDGELTRKMEFACVQRFQIIAIHPAEA